MNKEDRDFKHEAMMQHWRDCYGTGATWPHGMSAIMIELAIKEFYEAGFDAGYWHAKRRQHDE
jgi:hypothetical protein